MSCSSPRVSVNLASLGDQTSTNLNPMRCYAGRRRSDGDLMANTRDDHGSSGVSTILIDAAHSFGSPSWAVQKLFMTHQPAALLPARLNLAAVPHAAPPPPPPGPAGPGTVTAGCCGDTDLGNDCDSDPKGAWSAKVWQTHRLAVFFNLRSISETCAGLFANKCSEW